jgi:hypothetical protein
MNAPAESRQGDFIDQVIVDMDKERFLIEDFYCQSDLWNLIC